jgi:queuosine precursor transporter
VVLAGFVVGVASSLVGSQIMLQGDGYTYAAVPLRVAVGSGVAFLAAQLLDVTIFNALRRRRWWLAPLASTLVGSAVDTALFFSIAFAAEITVFGEGADAAINWAWDGVPFLGVGAVVPLWVSLAVADWLVKLSLALVALVPFKLLVTKLSPDAA